MNLILTRPSMCVLLMVRALTGGLLIGVEPDLGPTKEQILAMAADWAKAEQAARLAWDSDWLPPENSPWLPDWQSLNELRHPVFLPVSMDTKHTLAPAIRRFLLYGSTATRGTAAYRVKT